MKKSFGEYAKESTRVFFEAAGNIFIFLPYFFSVNTISKTLFAPWKNISAAKTTKGFSFSELGNRLSYNMVSRGMGFVMRVSILIFYVLFQVAYFLSLIVIVPLFMLFLPILYLINISETSEEEKKVEMKSRFVTSHTLKPENQQVVEQWFEKIYTAMFKKSQWWKLENLFAMPPIARDWSTGYTPYLDDYADDLSDTVYQAHIKHIIGRVNEITAIENILSKEEEANVLLVGEEGVGKHAVIDAFAKRIYEGKTNNLLAYKRVLKLDMEKILTSYTDQKKREVFFEDLLAEAAHAENIIILIENIEKYISTGEGHVDLSIPIEKFGKTASLQFVGTTSPYFYQKYLAPNEQLNRIFTRVDIYEVSRLEAIEILINTVQPMEHRYNVVIPYETILNTIDKSDFFITSLPFPEKAVQLLDSACVYAIQSLHKNVITPEVINAVLTEKTHVPVSLSASMKDKLLHIEPLLLQHIVDQEAAVKEVASALRRAFLLLGKRKKPLASFLFLGPTGVGKTETAKAISQIFFDSENNLLRFDMSLYQTKEDIAKLVGSQEKQSPGLLTEAIRNFPYGVLLLDELEKANHDLLNIFLTILDEGYFTNGFGKKVDCKNLIIVATSNAGAEEIFKRENDTMKQETTSNLLSPDVQTVSPQFNIIEYLVENHLFSPEFLNRFDGIVVFNNLDQNAALAIAKSMMKVVEDQILSLYKVQLSVSDATLQSIIDTSYDPKFGARDMERALRQQLEDKVAKIILEDKAKEGDTISL